MTNAPPSPTGKHFRFAKTLDELLLVALLVVMLAGVQLGFARTVGHGGLGRIRISPDGRLVATSLAAGGAVFDTDTSHLRYRLPADVELEFSPDGRWLAVASGGRNGSPGSLRVFHALTGALILNETFDSRMWSASLAFSQAGDLVAVRGGVHRILVWSLPGGRLVRRLDLERGFGCEMAFVAGDKLLVTELASTSTGHNIFLYDTATGEKISTWRGSGSWPRWLSVSADGTRATTSIGSAKKQPRIRVWDTTTGEEAAYIHGLYVCYDITREGRYLLAKRGQDLVIWDVRREEVRAVVLIDADSMAARFVNDDRQVLVATSGNTIIRWDLETASVVSNRSGFRFHFLGISALQVAGFLGWVVLWFFAYRVRRRHPERPTGRPELGAFALPILAAGFVVTYPLYRFGVMSIVPWEPSRLISLMGAASLALSAETLGGVAVFVLWWRDQFRGRLVLMLPCFGIVAWLWLSLLMGLPY